MSPRLSLSGRPVRALAIGTLVLVGTFTVFALRNTPVRTAQAASPSRAQITVTGNGQVTVPPTQAQVVLGTQVEAKTAQAALSKEALDMEHIVAALTALHIPRSALQTQGYSVNPDQMQNQSGTGPITGFTVVDTLSINLNTVSEVGQILDRAVAAGANQIQGVSFSGTNAVQVQNEAEGQAITNAKAQAEAAAKRLGLTLGPVQSINLEPGQGVSQSFAVMHLAATSAAPDILPPQGVTDSAQVQITYALLP